MVPLFLRVSQYSCRSSHKSLVKNSTLGNYCGLLGNEKQKIWRLDKTLLECPPNTLSPQKRGPPDLADVSNNLHEEGRTRLAGETEIARAFAISPAADNPLRYRRFRETCGCHGSFLAFSQGLLIKFRNDFMEQLIPVHLHLQAHED